ncbi:Sister chromatid cohesion 1 protein 1 [Ananas comosus]|uniref:Sister chromatid cohesion 1 protein 1 n=1 Tax=Ananas comosus TaxID=4615 RepID=A0A199VY46_ANACO|nr:Sister chromatid cohesion 1 protein 1 [Ananas comosus]
MFRSEMGSHTLDLSMEKLRANLENIDFQGAGDTVRSGSSVTPGSPGQRSKSFSSSDSGGTFMPLEPEIQIVPPGRSKRRQNSSSNSLGNLDPVEEEFPLQQNVRNFEIREPYFKIRRLSDIGPTPETELLEETVPTQTPLAVDAYPSVDKITQSMRTHFKLHFDTPGAPQSESLNQLAFGMSKTKAAQLFYQTCVLATLGFIRAEQVKAFGDILISRGPNM